MPQYANGQNIVNHKLHLNFIFPVYNKEKIYYKALRTHILYLHVCAYEVWLRLKRQGRECH